MRISFDLDDTLICYAAAVPREPSRIPFFLKPWFNEPLRLGTVHLLSTLAAQGHELWVYTTSFRSPTYVKYFFRLHGIRLAGVINQTIHNHHVRGPNRPSKSPNHFSIDLHMDDSEGVQRESEKHFFHMLLIRPTDPNWTTTVLSHIAKFSHAPK